MVAESLHIFYSIPFFIFVSSFYLFIFFVYTFFILFLVFFFFLIFIFLIFLKAFFSFLHFFFHFISFRFFKWNQIKITWSRVDIAPKINHANRGPMKKVHIFHLLYLKGHETSTTFHRKRLAQNMLFTRWYLSKKIIYYIVCAITLESFHIVIHRYTATFSIKTCFYGN